MAVEARALRHVHAAGRRLHHHLRTFHDDFREIQGSRRSRSLLQTLAYGPYFASERRDEIHGMLAEAHLRFDRAQFGSSSREIARPRIPARKTPHLLVVLQCQPRKSSIAAVRVHAEAC